jgi:hypothetical protein
VRKLTAASASTLRAGVQRAAGGATGGDGMELMR